MYYTNGEQFQKNLSALCLWSKILHKMVKWDFQMDVPWQAQRQTNINCKWQVKGN